MLEKNRHKRPGIEQVLDMEWFAEFREINRRGSGDVNQFAAYALTRPDSPSIKNEID